MPLWCSQLRGQAAVSAARMHANILCSAKQQVHRYMCTYKPATALLGCKKLVEEGLTGCIVQPRPSLALS